MKNTAGLYPGPAVPSAADGASLLCNIHLRVVNLLFYALELKS